MKNNKMALGHFIVAGIFAGIVAACLLTGKCKDSKQQFKPDRANFKAGEIILPDYAHEDTLIVINPSRLNREIEECDGSDGDIAGALYRSCAILGQSVPEYGLNVDTAGYWLFDYGYRDSVRGTWDKTNFDSLMYNWND